MALSLRFTEQTVCTTDGQAKLGGVLRSYLERGGQHAQNHHCRRRDDARGPARPRSLS